MKRTRKFLPADLGRVLDVGSLNVNGSAKDVYHNFNEYIGIDIREGKGVDMIMNGHSLVHKFGKNSFDVVVCMNMLEHDDKFWLTMKAMDGVLKKGGYYVLCVPTFGFPIHRHPKDYWRMNEEAVREVVLDGYNVHGYEEFATREHEGKGINPVICAIGRKL